MSCPELELGETSKSTGFSNTSRRLPAASLQVIDTHDLKDPVLKISILEDLHKLINILKDCRSGTKLSECIQRVIDTIVDTLEVIACCKEPRKLYAVRKYIVEEFVMNAKDERYSPASRFSTCLSDAYWVSEDTVKALSEAEMEQERQHQIKMAEEFEMKIEAVRSEEQEKTDQMQKTIVDQQTQLTALEEGTSARHFAVVTLSNVLTLSKRGYETLIYDKIVRISNVSDFDPKAGCYTIPVSGWWHVSVHCYISSAGNYTSAFEIYPSFPNTPAYWRGVLNSDYFNLTHSNTLYLEKGFKVTVRYLCGAPPYKVDSDLNTLTCIFLGP